VPASAVLTNHGADGRRCSGQHHGRRYHRAVYQHR